MKALAVVEEVDPQGTVIGVQGVVEVLEGNRPLIIGWAFLVVWILLLVFACLHTANGAADSSIILQESGHFSGMGYHELSASGSLCNVTVQPANRSLNATFWKIWSNGTIMGAA